MHHSANEINVCDCKIEWNWLFDGFILYFCVNTRESIRKRIEKDQSPIYDVRGRLSAYRTEEIDYGIKFAAAIETILNRPFRQSISRGTHIS